MGKAQTRTTETIEKSARAHQLVQAPRQNRESAAAPPQIAYRRGQVNPARLTPADLLALQRTVGNHAVLRHVVQRMAGRRTDSRLVQRFFTYRGGPHEAANYVPQIPRDMSGGKRGLSTFENVKDIPAQYRPAQKIETDNLGAELEAVRNGSGPKDSHVSIVPANDRALPPPPATSKKPQKVTYEKLTAWAQEGVKHPYTVAVMNARTEEVK
jgi:hypothetical protein